MRHHVVRLSFLAALAAAPLTATAAGELAAPTSSPAAALPELPRLPPITHPEPDPAAVRELDRLLDEITSADARARDGARAALSEPIPGVVEAIRLRVQDIRGSLDRDAAPHVLAEARKAGRKAQKGDDRKDEGREGKKGDKKPDKKKDGGAEKKKGDAQDKRAEAAKEGAADKKKDDGERKRDGKGDDEGDGDWLDFMLAAPHPKESVWRDVVKLLAMERMLVAVGTTPAVRELIALHAYFGDLLRIDLQRQIAKLRDKAVPALIEARQHDAKIVQRWANKQLDLLGRAIPGEAVASNEPQILADVLLSYGRTRDVDAVRVILSFCNSDRARLREAAREAIAAIGEPGIWQLRDAYLNLTGNKAPRDWSWDRIARELFATYDRARLAEVYKLMDDGVTAANAGKLAEATDIFDKVLARSPLFERRKEMVKAYVERARSLERDHREDALAMLRKALRIDPTGEQAKPLEAEIAYLEGEILVDQGTPDEFTFKHALELDPTHAGAREALAALQNKTAERKSYVRRYIAAGGVGFAALLAMIFIGRRRAEPTPEPTSPGNQGTRPEPTSADTQGTHPEPTSAGNQGTHPYRASTAAPPERALAARPREAAPSSDLAPPPDAAPTPRGSAPALAAAAAASARQSAPEGPPSAKPDVADSPEQAT